MYFIEFAHKYIFLMKERKKKLRKGNDASHFQGTVIRAQFDLMIQAEGHF
jgi:hypothetical protein